MSSLMKLCKWRGYGLQEQLHSQRSVEKCERALSCVSFREGKRALLALIEWVSEWAHKGSSLFPIWMETGGGRVGLFHPCLFSSSWLEWNTTSGTCSYNYLHQKSDQGGIKFPLGSSPFTFFDPFFFSCAGTNSLTCFAVLHCDSMVATGVR